MILIPSIRGCYKANPHSTQWLLRVGPTEYIWWDSIDGWVG